MAMPQSEQVQPGPMVPEPFVVTGKHRDTADTWTIELEPRGGARLDFAPGQFTILSSFGA